VATSEGFPLNNIQIPSGTMTLRIRWADPKDDGNTDCCDALSPVLKNLYMKPKAVTKDVKEHFCKKCKKSPNQAIALAAYSYCEEPDIAV